MFLIILEHCFHEKYHLNVKKKKKNCRCIVYYSLQFIMKKKNYKTISKLSSY